MFFAVTTREVTLGHFAQAMEKLDAPLLPHNRKHLSSERNLILECEGWGDWEL